jgi:hypothetical protein
MAKTPNLQIRTGATSGPATGTHGNRGKPGYPLPDVLKNKIGEVDEDLVEKIVSSVSTPKDISSGSLPNDVVKAAKFIDLVAKKIVGDLKSESEKKEKDLGFGFNEDGFPLQDKYEFQGMPIAVENKQGTTRKWYDENGKEKGSTKMHWDYGYVEGAKGSDGDEVDVYVGPQKDAEFAYVVHQNKAPDFEEYDEDKVMLGFNSESEAKEAYLKQYDDESFYGGMSSMPMEKFKEKVSSVQGDKITNEGILKEENKADMVAALFCSFKPFHKGHGKMLRDLSKKFSKIVVMIVADGEWTAQKQIDWTKKSAPDIFSKLQIVPTTSGKIFSAIDDAAMDKTSINGDTAVTLIVPQEKLADTKQDLKDLAEQNPDDLYWDASASVVMSYSGFDSEDSVGGVDGTQVREMLFKKDVESLKKLLDPHLVSNKEDFESLVNGKQNESLEKAGGIRDVEDTVDSNAQLLAKRSPFPVNVGNLQLLGAGTQGPAYDMGGNKVLKVTTDKSEAQASLKLKGKNLKHVNNFYDVFKFPPGGPAKGDLYGIIQDKLTPLNDAEKMELNDGIGWFMDPELKTSVRPFIERGDWEGALKAIQHVMEQYYVQGKIKEATTTAPARGSAFKPAKDAGGPQIKPMGQQQKVDPQVARTQAQREYARVLQIFKKYQIGEMIKEVRSQGLTFIDYHDGNIMKRGSSYVINDLGGSEGGGNEPPVMESFVKAIISEIGAFTGPGNTRTGMSAGSSKWSSGQTQLDTSIEDTWQNNFNNFPRSGSVDTTQE